LIRIEKVPAYCAGLNVMAGPSRRRKTFNPAPNVIDHLRQEEQVYVSEFFAFNAKKKGGLRYEQFAGE
jgi:hypothetical protein